jgi:hypothetical protein
VPPSFGRTAEVRLALPSELLVPKWGVLVFPRTNLFTALTPGPAPTRCYLPGARGGRL